MVVHGSLRVNIELRHLLTTKRQSLFSMSFFDWNPDQGKRILSPYIWMYVVLTAGLTGLTLTLWYFFGRPHLKEKGDRDDVESQVESRQQAVEK